MALPSDDMLALPRGAFARLRDLVWHATAEHAPGYLQEAGYGAGEQVYQGFVNWCAKHSYGVPESIAAANFPKLAEWFFNELGWGHVSVGTIGNAVVTVDANNLPDVGAQVQFPGCYMSSGMFADFFSRLAGAQLVSREVECRTIGNERCRFVIASAETIQHMYDGMAQGMHYEQALS